MSSKIIQLDLVCVASDLPSYYPSNNLHEQSLASCETNTWGRLHINSNLYGHIWSAWDGKLLPEAKAQVDLQASESERAMVKESDIRVRVHSGGYGSELGNDPENNVNTRNWNYKGSMNKLKWLIKLSYLQSQVSKKYPSICFR